MAAVFTSSSMAADQRFLFYMHILPFSFSLVWIYLSDQGRRDVSSSDMTSRFRFLLRELFGVARGSKIS